MTSTAVTGSAERWGALWGARPADWALSEDQQVPTYAEALRRVGLEPAQLVLDIGCGVGAFLRLVTDRDARAFGLDASDALREYARNPVAFTPLKSDALLRLLICDLVGEEVTRESMATLRDDLADIAARLEDAERRAADLPHREKYLRLVTGFLRRFLELHEELLDDVERELTSQRKPRSPQPA